jgi:hypothetical protein
MRQTAVSPIRERPRKSLATALALAFVLGPIGLLYASRVGAVVMLIVCAVVLVPIRLGVPINVSLYFPVWVVCVVWAGIAAHERSCARPESPPEGDWVGETPPGAAAGTRMNHDGAPGRS